MQSPAYEVLISDVSSDLCASDLRDAGPGSCAQEAGAGLAGAGFAVSAGFAAGLASAAVFASALAASGLAAALSVPSTRLLFLSPSFLKSVSYQPLPASRNDGAVTWRRTCPAAPQDGHASGSGSDSFCRRSKSCSQAADRKSTRLNSSH